MSSENRHKLNLLITQWPLGTLMTHAMLQEKGIYQQLVNKYTKSGWLEPIARGVFKRAGDTVDWTGALALLQTQLHLSVHLAGKTALEFSGIQHFFHLGGGGVIWLFGKPGENLPKWFLGGNTWDRWNRKIKYITPKLFDDASLGLTEQQIGRHISTDSVTQKHPSQYKIVVSSIERAVLEMLYLIPREQSLVEAKYLMEGLMTLRPNLMQALLEQCRSIKAKRLFLFLADFCNLPCLMHMDLSSVNLGKGKRVIGAGGHYVPKYRISIPTDFVATFKEEFERNE